MNVSDARARLLKSAKGFRVASDDSDLDAMAALAHYVIQQMGSGHQRRADRVLREAENCLSEGDSAVQELICVGFVEDLGNISSHADVPVSPPQVRGRLTPLLGAAWDQVDAFWIDVAPHKPALDPEGKALKIEQYESVKDPQLRRLLQQMHRRMPDGTLVGLAEVLRYEARSGRSMGHRSKAE